MEFDLEQFKQGIKARTRDGRIATFVGICEDCDKHHRLIAHVEGSGGVDTFYTNGAFAKDGGAWKIDLVSMVSPWENVSIDAKVRVRISQEIPWRNGHFAGLEDGEPTIWQNGQTSWSSRDKARITWEFMELVED